MVHPNKKTTLEALKNSKYDFWVHKGSFDRISEILERGSLLGREYVSFTDGMPLLQTHGGSIISFDRQKLVDKGFHFLKIKYDLEFLKQNKEIFDHVLEYQSEDELRESFTKEVNLKIERLKRLLREDPKSRPEIFPTIKQYRKIKKDALKDIIEYFIKMIKVEEEIITKSPLEFDESDVLKIVYPSKTFEHYYPAPKVYQDRIIFAEDYWPPGGATFSPLYYWMAEKTQDPIFSQAKGINQDITNLYLLIFGLLFNEKWNIYAEWNPKPLTDLPKKWDSVFKKIDLLLNDEEKVDIIDYVFRVYILGYQEGNSAYENQLIEHANAQF